MEFNECLFNRRSIRKFNNKKISDDTIKDIINAGIYAPSACNFEAWKFIIIKKDTKNREKLENAIALSAPYGILVLYRNDLYVTGRVYKDYVQSASAAIENMLLYITSIDLGGVWICGLPKESKIKKAFNIPKNFDVIGYIAFGNYDKDNENSKSDAIYHYGSEEAFKNRYRKYSIEQVICDNEFKIVDGDCTYTKYPNKKTLYIKKLKANVKRILRKK